VHPVNDNHNKLDMILDGFTLERAKLSRTSREPVVLVGQISQDERQRLIACRRSSSSSPTKNMINGVPWACPFRFKGRPSKTTHNALLWSASSKMTIVVICDFYDKYILA
jgi:hypothetical protein